MMKLRSDQMRFPERLTKSCSESQKTCLSKKIRKEDIEIVSRVLSEPFSAKQFKQAKSQASVIEKSQDLILENPMMISSVSKIQDVQSPILMRSDLMLFSEELNGSSALRSCSQPQSVYSNKRARKEEVEVIKRTSFEPVPAKQFRRAKTEASVIEKSQDLILENPMMTSSVSKIQDVQSLVLARSCLSIQKVKMVTSWNNLPEDMICLIASYLTSESFLDQTSKTNYHLIHSSHLSADVFMKKEMRLSSSDGLFIHEGAGSLIVDTLDNIENVHRLYPKVRAIRLENQEIKTLSFLEYFPNIVSLDLSSCSHLSREEFAHLAYCPSLEKLNLSYCNQIRSTSFLKYCPQITHLEMIYCLRLKYTSGVSQCENLRVLSFEGSSFIEDLSALRSCKSLTHLNISGCDAIRNIQVISELQDLSEVFFEDCTQIESFEPLRSCCKIKNLDLSDCIQINDLFFLRSMSDLKKLDISGCSLIGDFNFVSTLPKDVEICVNLEFLEVVRFFCLESHKIKTT